MTRDGTPAADDETVGETAPGVGGDARAGGTMSAGARAVLATFPWFGAFVAGVGAFVVGYAGLLALLLATPLALPGPLSELPVRTGFLFYNAHNVVVTGTALEPNIITGNEDYLRVASQPFLYRAYPAVVIAAAGGLFTYWWGPERRSALAAVTTAVAMATGYVLIALAGTVVVSLEDKSVLYSPDIAQTLLYFLAYGGVFGFCGSLAGQAAVVDGEPAESD
ncbi:hypothetical protein [Halorientalis halophila]|uniref:hypothetical protein n=1 Tax=Halorientalis halophila TaxID=3108499 RepID=UPI00300837D9